METKFQDSRIIQQVAPDVAYLQVLIANLCFVGNSGNTDWVLVDAGVPQTAPQIKEAAAALFGNDARPRAIILTHGHFDHVGAAQELAVEWDTPVYAHELEMPYLTGKSSYPPPAPCGAGLKAKLSPLYPHEPIDLGNRVHVLPKDETVPFLTGWRWVFTPGHTPGHISLFRDSDRVLIAGDAFTTVKQESAWAVMAQDKEVHGPPVYFTINWQEALRSIEKLRALNPSIAITGRGKPIRDGVLKEQLDQLICDLKKEVLPQQGYSIPCALSHPAPPETAGINESGPPPP